MLPTAVPPIKFDKANKLHFRQEILFFSYGNFETRVKDTTKKQTFERKERAHEKGQRGRYRIRIRLQAELSAESDLGLKP